jgi:hypothetical protein
MQKLTPRRAAVPVLCAVLAAAAPAAAAPAAATAAATARATVRHWTVSYVDTAQPAEFRDVAAIAWNDVWAVGVTDEFCGQRAPQSAIVKRYDGRRWVSVQLPRTYRTADLWAVGGSSPRNVWILGRVTNALGGDAHVLALRWNGVQWSRLGWWAGNGITSQVLVLSPSDVWAFGIGTRHYNGHAWTRYRYHLPYGLLWASAISPNDIWAAGYVRATQAPTAARWHNGAWTQVPLPAITSSPPGPYVTGIYAASDKDVWEGVTVVSVSDRASAQALRWDGTTWTTIPVPAVVSLEHINGDGHGGAWAVANGQGAVAHFTAGTWRISRLPHPTGRPPEPSGLARVPRSTTVYVVGQLQAGACPRYPGFATVWKYRR